MKIIDTLLSYSLNSKIEELKLELDEESYVLDKVALFGQATVLFGPPNSGKTLYTINQLKHTFDNGLLNDRYIFYINADDSKSGIAHKGEILSQINVQQLAPGYEGFNLSDFFTAIKHVIKEDIANKVVFIVDTIKKFVDTMDKARMREFGILIRQFTSKGGTFIGLGHTNKNKDINGNLVYSGTSDLMEDMDCTYMLEVVEDHISNGIETKTLKLTRGKKRGDNIAEIVGIYRQQEDQSYEELVDSFEFPQLEDYQKKKQERDLIEKEKSYINEYNDAYNLIQKELINCTMSKKELVESIMKNTKYGRDKSSEIIDFLTGKIISYELSGKTKKQKPYKLIL